MSVPLKPPHPSDLDEALRQSLLLDLGVLDTDSELGFDALIGVAAALTQCPVALLSLLDGERQWFKARLGFEPSQTPRQESFCNQAICSPDLMVVPDARLDPRFAASPLVVGEPGIRFYAGQPLTVDGVRIGTLCVIDTQPHGLSDAAREALRQLGIAASAMLAERRNRVTSEKQQRDLIIAREAADKAAEVRAEFMSRVSHELRTPLNAILGFAQLMRTKGTQQPMADMLKSVQHIETAGAHLLALVNDMLDLSSLDAGRLNLDIQPVALPALLAHCVELIEPHARLHGITLETQLDAALPTVLADARAVKQLLFNLIGNAVKFSNPNSVVRVQVSQTAGSPNVALAIIDAGPGIAADQLPTLFRPFNRLQTGHRKPPGSGLGLSISQKLVMAMGGTIAVSSLPGQGTTFTVTLPADGRPDLGTADDSAFGDLHIEAPTHGTDQAHVLYIEDEPVNALLMQAFFNAMPGGGARLLVAVNGADGVADAARVQPQLILLDMNLPDMDGLSVLHALRSSPRTARIPVIAVSADALPDQILKARQAGCQDYWTKPISMKRVQAELLRVFSAVPQV